MPAKKTERLKSMDDLKREFDALPRVAASDVEAEQDEDVGGVDVTMMSPPEVARVRAEVAAFSERLRRKTDSRRDSRTRLRRAQRDKAELLRNIADAGGYDEWHEVHVRRVRDSKEQREIDHALGRRADHRDRYATYHELQVTMRERATRSARLEAARRYRYVYLCYCYTCVDADREPLFERLEGVRRADAFRIRHGRHTTFEHGVLVKGDPTSGELDEEQRWSRKHGKEV